MDVDVKNVIRTYRAAMTRQVPNALRAIARASRPVAPSSDPRAAAIPLLHAYCFHESNFHLLSEMARAHAIPEELIPRFCDRTGSLGGMSLFVTLAEAMRKANGLTSSTDRVEPPGNTAEARSNNSRDRGRRSAYRS